MDRMMHDSCEYVFDHACTRICCGGVATYCACVTEWNQCHFSCDQEVNLCAAYFHGNNAGVARILLCKTSMLQLLKMLKKK